MEPLAQVVQIAPHPAVGQQEQRHQAQAGQDHQVAAAAMAAVAVLTEEAAALRDIPALVLVKRPRVVRALELDPSPRQTSRFRQAQWEGLAKVAS
jgi:hypothetical protein